MDCRRSAALVVWCALTFAAAPATSAPERLDLDVDPAQVAKWDAQPPPHDQVIRPSAEASAMTASTAEEPGWSLRPTADVDVGRDGGERPDAGAGERTLDLGDVTLDLNSLGLRLQRTW